MTLSVKYIFKSLSTSQAACTFRKYFSIMLIGTVPSISGPGGPSVFDITGPPEPLIGPLMPKHKHQTHKYHYAK